MNKITACGLGVLMLSVFAGCAGPVQQVEPEDAKGQVILECRSSYPHGCRHVGQVVPWDQWVEMMGYPGESFKIVDIRKSGTIRKVVLQKL